MLDALLHDLPAALGMAVFERLDSAGFRVLGALPGWCRSLYPAVFQNAQTCRIGSLSPFLENFLVDAEYFWRQHSSGQLRSGAWHEQDASGKTLALEATALHVDERPVLLLEQLGESYQEKQYLLQMARQQHLDYHRLARAEAALARNHEDVLALLNQLRIGTAMVDASGCLTFLSDSCQRLLGNRDTAKLGQRWEHVFPFSKRDKQRIMSLVALPPEQRQKVPVHLETSAGRHFWLEVEVQDDPRDPQRKIVLFYDVTAVHDLRRLLNDKAHFHDIIGKSEEMLQLFQHIRDLARVDTTVLIEGETGSGKELVARALHTASTRHAHPFIAVNCAGLTESLVASQLFGHRRGSFTGAVTDHQGFFEAAHHGTIFLDEIGDIPLSIQTSLLRVLQEREIVRLGESRPRKVDVRVLAATHRDLAAEVEKGTFRQDLLYRLRVARLRLPPLRERRQDIPLFVSAFLTQGQTTLGKNVEEVSQEAMQALLNYPWPGNVRELKSAIEFAIIHCRGTVLHCADLPPEIRESAQILPTPTAPTPGNERQRFLAALEQAGGSRTEAARLLGMSRATFYRRLASLNIVPSA